MMARQPSTRMNSGGLDPNSPTHPDPAMRPSGRNTSMGRLQGEDNESENDEEEEEEEGGDDDGDDEAKGAEEGEQLPVRMSLMSLLAETDAYVMDEEEEDDGGGVAAYNTCCVCIVRHKGTAFVPCGHSFCRLCSRELVVDRENCPLCNNYILEILDIF